MEEKQRVFRAGNERVRPATGKVPPAKALEVGELGRAAQSRAGAPRIAQEIEVMANEPHHAVVHQPLEEVATDFVVGGAVEGFAQIVEERSGPEIAVVRRGPRQVEDLERMEEGVALGMIARVLRHAIEGLEETKKLVVHLPEERATPTGVKPRAKRPRPRPPAPEIPDARDGLTRKERVVLWVLAETQKENDDRAVKLPMLYGRVLEHVDMSIEELQAIVGRLGARRP